VNRPALAALATFIEQPEPKNVRSLYRIPVIYKVLEIEYSPSKPGYSEDILEVVRWMFERAKDVLLRVLKTNMTPLPLLVHPGSHLAQRNGEIRDWEKVSVFNDCEYGYGMLTDENQNRRDAGIHFHRFGCGQRILI
jgi:hypothetical protein